MEMWAQGATAMYTYAADSSTMSTLTSFNEPPPTTNDTAQGAQARAMTQTVANTTGARTQSLVQQASTNTASHSVDYTPPASADPSIPPGGTADVPPGSIISVGTNTTMHVEAGSVTMAPEGRAGGLVVTAKSSITLNPGSVFTAVPGAWLEGGTPVTDPVITVGVPAVTLTSAHPFFGSTGILNAGSVTLFAQSGITPFPAPSPTPPTARSPD